MKINKRVKRQDLRIALNKLTMLIRLRDAGVSIPPFTEEPGEAARWLIEGFRVVARHSLAGRDGEGLQLIDGDDPLSKAPLYTQYVKYDVMFRIHVAGNKMVCAEIKKRTSGVQPMSTNPFIQTKSNGWQYYKPDVGIPVSVVIEAIRAVQALNLDYGAADVAYRRQGEKAYVIKVDPSPRLNQSQATKYAKRIKEVRYGRE